MAMIEFRPPRHFISDLLHNLRAGLWLLLGSLRAFNHVTPTALQLVVLGALAIGANTLFSWLSSEGLGVFNGQGLISYLLWPFLALLAGIFMAQRSGVSQAMLIPVILWLAADLFLALLQSGLQYLGARGWIPPAVAAIMPTVFLLIFLWPNLMLLFLLARRNRWPWWENALILVGTLVTLVIWQQAVINQPIFKQIIPVNTPQISENLIYAQPRLLDDTLDQLLPGQPGLVEWYFMGVAGAGYQGVFASEINSIHTQFDTRFGTIGRSVSLINNPNTHNTVPIATRTSIERTLRRIGEKMNPDEDVLFLYLTSHGNPDVFELANAPISMQSVDPMWLRETLDQSGIKWRVIVISACYSGSFIPALQSPHTLIITAAAADRASFGCENESDFTWFGKAFFLEGMNREKDLKAAFQLARQQVGRWEADQRYPASQPQWRIGTELDKFLPQLQYKLFNPAQPVIVPALLPPVPASSPLPADGSADGAETASGQVGPAGIPASPVAGSQAASAAPRIMAPVPAASTPATSAGS